MLDETKQINSKILRAGMSYSTYSDMQSSCSGLLFVDCYMLLYRSCTELLWRLAPQILLVALIDREVIFLIAHLTVIRILRIVLVIGTGSICITRARPFC